MEEQDAQITRKRKMDNMEHETDGDTGEADEETREEESEMNFSGSEEMKLGRSFCPESPMGSGHPYFQMSMTLPWVYYAERKPPIPPEKQLQGDHNEFVMHHFCLCKQPKVNLSEERRSAYADARSNLDSKLLEKLLIKLPNLMNAADPHANLERQWRSHGAFIKGVTVKKYLRTFMKKSRNNTLNNGINEIFEDKTGAKHLKFDQQYVGMRVKRLHRILEDRMKRKLIFQCVQLEERWALKEVRYILDSKYKPVHYKYKKTGGYKWLQPKRGIKSGTVVYFHKLGMVTTDAGIDTDDDKDDEKESGVETPKKRETSKKRPGELSENPIPKKAKRSEAAISPKGSCDITKRKCPDCNRSFGSRRAFDDHYKDKHTLL